MKCNKKTTTYNDSKPVIKYVMISQSMNQRIKKEKDKYTYR
jgi:hypothetical protein